MRAGWLVPGFVAVVFALDASALRAPSLLAQVMPFALGGDNPESENSLTPFKVKLRGFLNSAAPSKNSLGEVILQISSYKELYKFDVATAEAVDNPRISSTAILQKAKKRQVGFNLTGPKELLSKIGQAEPGTPLAIVGFLQQRNLMFPRTNGFCGWKR
jgi:hypothetical protein